MLNRGLESSVPGLHFVGAPPPGALDRRCDDTICLGDLVHRSDGDRRLTASMLPQRAEVTLQARRTAIGRG